jgi:hypothetical protein
MHKHHEQRKNSSSALHAPDGHLVKRDIAVRCQKHVRAIERWMDLKMIPYLKLGKGRRATVLFNWPDVQTALKRFEVGGQ